MFEILLVDDSPAIQSAMSEMLRRAGYVVRTANNGKEAIEQQARKPADLVITDIMMPDVDGLETILSLKKAKSSVKILAMSGAHNPNVPIDFLKIARKFGAADTLAKPFSRDELLEKVKGLLESGKGNAPS